MVQSDSGAIIRSGIQSAFQFDMEMPQPLLLLAPESVSYTHLTLPTKA